MDIFSCIPVLLLTCFLTNPTSCSIICSNFLLIIRPVIWQLRCYLYHHSNMVRFGKKCFIYSLCPYSNKSFLLDICLNFPQLGHWLWLGSTDQSQHTGVENNGSVLAKLLARPPLWVSWWIVAPCFYVFQATVMSYYHSRPGGQSVGFNGESEKPSKTFITISSPWGLYVKDPTHATYEFTLKLTCHVLILEKHFMDLDLKIIRTN